MSEHISIDTSDLAYSLDNVTERVGETTSAVSEMSRSVCDAEREAANDVCRSVNQGFFTLIHSQLMQKKVQVQAVAESQLLTLRHFAQSLRRIKQQMGVDFERITLRYTKLFKTLGESLQSRVYTLDRPVAEVADGDYGTLDRRVLTSGAPAVLVQQDSVSVAAELSAVRCKKDCQKVLDGVKDLINHGTTLSRKMDSIVRDVHQEQEQSVFLPFIVCENSDLFLANSSQVNFTMPVENCASVLVSKVKKACYEAESKFVWASNNGERKSEITRRVRDLVSKQIRDERVSNLIVQLLGESNWQGLEAIG